LPVEVRSNSNPQRGRWAGGFVSGDNAGVITSAAPPPPPRPPVPAGRAG
jgi:hypothetical protein